MFSVYFCYKKLNFIVFLIFPVIKTVFLSFLYFIKLEECLPVIFSLIKISILEIY